MEFVTNRLPTYLAWFGLRCWLQRSWYLHYFQKACRWPIIVIAYAGDLFTSYASSGNSLPTHLYAYGMLAYSTNVIIAAALFTYYIATILLISPPGPGTNPVSMISMYAMVLLLGRALSWSEKTTRKRFEAAQNKNRLQELESRARIADAIHDAVTGDLVGGGVCGTTACWRRFRQP